MIYSADIYYKLSTLECDSVLLFYYLKVIVSFSNFHFLYLFIYQILGVSFFFESFCNNVTLFLLHSQLVEDIVFMRKGWLYGILSLRELEWFDCTCKYICWSVGLRNIVAWVLCCWSLYTIVSRNSICLVDFSTYTKIYISICLSILWWLVHDTQQSAEILQS